MSRYSKPLGRQAQSALVSLILLAFVFQPLAYAAPTGGQVTSGSSTINQNGSVTDINQSSQKTSINWQSFSINPSETVNFNQPNAQAIALNRVIGNERSLIEGALNANGKVFLVNSSGVMFTKGAKVNVGGLVASTLDITDEDFNKGNYVFQGNSNAQVVNMGKIKAADGGYVALLGKDVVNEGVIVAQAGTVSLNGANKATLNFNGDSLVSVSLDEGALGALVANKKAIIADGGKVILTAKAADDILGAQVNNTGLIQARTIAELNGAPAQKGSIVLYAHGGTTKVAGKLDASAPKGGDGGFIETSGKTVKIADKTQITTKAENGKTGTWLLDPANIVISDSGRESLPTSPADDNITSYIKNTFLSGLLASDSADIKLQADNDITVEAVIDWASKAVLTLIAGHDININKAINVLGDGTLKLLYGHDYNIRTKASYSGTVIDPATGFPVAKVDTSGGQYGSIKFGATGGNLYIGGDDADHNYKLIHDMTELAAITGVKGNYALADKIDIDEAVSYSAAVVATLAGGSNFAGLGHVIKNLTIKSATANTGLFGTIGATNDWATVRDLGIQNATVTVTASVNNAGILAGESYGNIHHAYSTGAITGYQYVGGLVGGAQQGSIDYSYSDALVTGSWSSLGGLVGRLYFAAMSDAHATGQVKSSTSTGSDSGFGGLVGQSNSSIKNSYATGAVDAQGGTKKNMGGLVGYLQNNTSGTPIELTNSFATGAVWGVHQVGGLIGQFDNNVSAFDAPTGSVIDNCWASGQVTANGSANNGKAGGLVGYLSGNYSKTIKNSHASGDVELKGGRSAGGLVGDATASKVTIENSYATGDVNATGSTGYNFGGLVGVLSGSNNVLRNSWASGSVIVAYSGDVRAGGLIGFSQTAQIANSHAYGNVTAENGELVGGLIGYVMASNISGSSASGNVTGLKNVGGLVGSLLDGGTITDSSSGGKVTGGSNTGALAGWVRDSLTDSSSITNSYWNADNSGQSSAVGLDATNAANLESTGLTDEQFKDVEYYRDGTIDEVLFDRSETIRLENKRIADAQAAQTAAEAAAQAAQVAAQAAAQAAQVAAQAAIVAQIRQETIAAVQQMAGNQTAEAAQIAMLTPGAVAVGGLNAPLLDLGNSIALDPGFAISGIQVSGSSGGPSSNLRNITQDGSFSANLQNLEVNGKSFSTATGGDDKERE